MHRFGTSIYPQICYRYKSDASPYLSETLRFRDAASYLLKVANRIAYHYYLVVITSFALYKKR